KVCCRVQILTPYEAYNEHLPPLTSFGVHLRQSAEDSEFSANNLIQKPYSQGEPQPGGLQCLVSLTAAPPAPIPRACGPPCTNRPPTATPCARLRKSQLQLTASVTTLSRTRNATKPTKCGSLSVRRADGMHTPVR